MKYLGNVVKYLGDEGKCQWLLSNDSAKDNGEGSKVHTQMKRENKTKHGERLMTEFG